MLALIIAFLSYHCVLSAQTLVSVCEVTASNNLQFFIHFLIVVIECIENIDGEWRNGHKTALSNWVGDIAFGKKLLLIY